MKWTLVLLSLILSLIARAQTCNSGLGDPIVKYTFGSGTTTLGGPLPAGITNMPYENTQCPEGGPDGGYTIAHSPGVDCFTGDWLNFTGDHTGDPNGYFMLINASTPPSDFYVQTVTGLCPSTSYQFAAWVVNMAGHSGEIDPNITFSIENPDGTVISSTSTGDIPYQNPVHWNQYACYFTTPPGISTVVIRMRNNAPGGYGNDLGLDDITFRTSGPSIDITIDGYTGDTATLCADPGNTLQFIGTVGSCYPSTSYQWQQSSDGGQTWNDVPGAVGPTFSAAPTASGSYQFRLAAAATGNIGITACQIASTPDTIVVLPANSPAVSILLNQSYTCVDSLSAFTASGVDTGSLPVYQWAVNHIPVTTTSGPAFNSGLTDGDQVSCTLISNALCATPTTAASNIITVSLLPNVVSSVSIQASANNICQDSIVVFTATPTNGGAHPDYQWLIDNQRTGSDTSVYSSGSLKDGDIVSVVLTSGLPCSNIPVSNVIPMTVFDIPQISLTPDTIIKGGTSITLDPSITGAYSTYQWSPATDLYPPTDLTPVASPVGTTVYQLQVTNGNGCTAVAKEKVEVFYDLAMPNAFTPNGDGRNDIYRIPPSIPLTIKRFSIYNRWGAVIFATSNSAEGWDGRIGGQPQPTGTYVWVIEYVNPILKKTMMKKGTLELIR